MKVTEAMTPINVQYMDILAIDSIVAEEKPTQCQMTMEMIQKNYGTLLTGYGYLEEEYGIEMPNSSKKCMYCLFNHVPFFVLQGAWIRTLSKFTVTFPKCNFVSINIT